MSAPVITAPIGSREPTYSSIPPGDTERGQQAVEFARLCGMTLFPWQEDVLRDMCRTGEDGYFSAPEVVVSVPRQNGKGEILVARELAGIYLFGEKTILHTAHHLDTAVSARARLWEVISENDFLMSWWDGNFRGAPREYRSNGKEDIRFPNGSIVMFRTRSDKTARGLTCNLVVLDEAFELPEQRYSAINSTTAAVAGSQIIFISSPVNQLEHIHGSVFSAKRWQGQDKAPGVYYAEWCAREDDNIHDIEAWKHANPSLVEDSPIGVQLKFIKQNSETAKNSNAHLEQFLVENMGIGNWCPRDGEEEDDNPPIFDDETIDSILTDETVSITRQVLAIDSHPKRESIGISLCGKTADGGYHVHTGYLGEYDMEKVTKMVLNLIEKVDPEMIAIDGKNPSNLIVPSLIDAGYDVEQLNYAKVTESTQLFLQLIDDGRLSITADKEGRAKQALQDIRLRESANGAVNFERFSGDVSGITSGAIGVWACNSALEAPVVVEKKPHRPRQKIVYKKKNNMLGVNRRW